MPTCDVKHGVGYADRREENRGFSNVWEEKKKSSTEISTLTVHPCMNAARSYAHVLTRPDRLITLLVT